MYCMPGCTHLGGMGEVCPGSSGEVGSGGSGAGLRTLTRPIYCWPGAGSTKQARELFQKGPG